MNNNIWEFELMVGSPVHIGSDKKYTKLDYVFDPQSQVVGLLNESAWLQWLIKYNLMDTYIDAIQSASSKSKNFNNFDWLQSINIKRPLQDYDHLFSAKFHIDHDAQRTLNDILSHIKTVDQRPYIPGSSLKGAFRSAILAYLIIKNRDNADLNNIWSDFKRELKQSQSIRSRNLRFYTENIESLLIYGKEYQEKKKERIDPFHGISISDSLPFKKEDVILCKKHDIVFSSSGNPVPREIPVWRECVRPNASSSFTVKLDGRCFQGTNLQFITGPEVLLECIKMQQSRILSFHESKLSDQLKSPINQSKIQYRPVGPPPDYNAIKLGSNTGFQVKSLVFALAKDEKEARDVTELILQKSFSQRRKTEDSIAEPRTLKTTFLTKAAGVKNSGRYKMGICFIHLKDR